MRRAEDLDNEFSGLEQQLALQLERYTPDSLFVQDLKQRLVSSQVFRRRQEIGAVVVASLGLLFVAALAFSLGQLFRGTKKSK